MTDDEKKELDELRRYKKRNIALNRAFYKVEQLLDDSVFDPLMSRRAFRCLGEALLLLKEEVVK